MAEKDLSWPLGLRANNPGSPCAYCRAFSVGTRSADNLVCTCEHWCFAGRCAVLIEVTEVTERKARPVEKSTIRMPAKWWHQLLTLSDQEALAARVAERLHEVWPHLFHNGFQNEVAREVVAVVAPPMEDPND